MLAIVTLFKGTKHDTHTHIHRKITLKLIMESVDKDMVVAWIKNGCTIQWISEELQKHNPDRRGLSARSVRRFCQKEILLK